MYQVENTQYHALYDGYYDEIINYFYSRDELIRFIARWYREDSNGELYNSFIQQCTCNKNKLLDLKDYKRYMIYDNLKRIVSVHDFELEAYTFYKKINKPINTFSLTDYLKIFKYPYSVKRYIKTPYYAEYRKDPVPYTKKIRGGPGWSPPHTAGIIRMYKNPEYKDFNRGSWHDIPTWWDDRTRRVQKSWKEQSKVRHQWEKNLV